MKATVIGHLNARLRRSLINSTKASFLIDASASLFAGQPVSVLIPPTPNIPASVHFMYFPPGLMQPLHKHPGDRQLLCVMGSTMRATYTLTDNPGRRDFVVTTFRVGQVGTLVIPSGVWHQFEVESEGDGAVAFSFHPLDEGKPEVLMAPDLMQALTTFFPS